MLISHYLQELTTDQTNSFCFALLKLKSHLYPADFQQLVESRDIRAICAYTFSYGLLSKDTAEALRQAQALFQKRSDLDLGVDRHQVAIDSFLESERRCSYTNALFRAREEGRFTFPPSVEAALSRASRKISQVLGDVPALQELKLRFGPGATTQVKRADASARRKLSMKHECGLPLSTVIRALGETMPDYLQVYGTSSVEEIGAIVQCGHAAIHTVPKTWKTDRTIAVEPSLNQMVQLGLGRWIEDRLRPHGVDVRSQDRNRELARLSSLEGTLATIDLSSASDLISRQLVRDLLPDEWFQVLDLSRSRTYTLQGQLSTFSKFMSSGNGFTFPLESLIFFALCWGICEKGETIAVYGDDIILPAARVPQLLEVFHAVGFTVNTEKSFAEGPFRESCGGDYFLGTNIRPFYLKEPLSGERAFQLHNFFFRKGEEEGAALVKELLDPALYLFGPDGFGDGHLLSHDSSFYVPHMRSRGWGGYTFETFTRRSRRAYYRLFGDYVFPSYSIYLREDAIGERLPFPSSDRRVRECLHLEMRPEPAPLSYQEGRLGDTLPGTEGVRRIKVYTFR